jgi:hypothetical protein
MIECTCTICKKKFECNANIKCFNAVKQHSHGLFCWCKICVQKASFFSHMDKKETKRTLVSCYGYSNREKEKVEFT